MRYRVYTEKNISKRTGMIFAMQFRTKKEAIAYAKTLNEPAKIERKLVTTWVPCV